MNIIIIGCGKVGSTLTEQLSSEEHNLVVIDTNPEKVQELSESYDVLGITERFQYRSSLQCGRRTCAHADRSNWF